MIAAVDPRRWCPHADEMADAGNGIEIEIRMRLLENDESALKSDCVVSAVHSNRILTRQHYLDPGTN